MPARSPSPAVPAAAPPAILSLPFERWRADGCPPLVERLSANKAPHGGTGAAAVMLRGALPPSLRELWVESVYRARDRWVSDFGGEQFALGRAFYTHLETDRSALYFREARRSDELVERCLPSMQALVRGTFGQLVGGRVRARLGFCGPGVHVFPAGGKVAREGGVVHFDVEGLTPEQLARARAPESARRRRTATLVWMLRPAAWGGGLALWDALYEGSEHPSEEALSRGRVTASYGAGDLLFSDSLRLHQIRPFRGDKDRMSITAHAVEVDAGVWECWF